jgi:hypothetical protein
MRWDVLIALGVTVSGCSGGIDPAPDQGPGSSSPGQPDAAPTAVAPDAASPNAPSDAGAIPGKADSQSGSLGADAASDGTSQAPGWWHPTPGMTWDWQLVVPIDQTAMVDVYDIDLFENAADVVAGLHARGRKVICYVDLGSWESYRPDASSFPSSILGAMYVGYPNERWLDIRRIDLLTPIVRSRLDMAKAKGCDAVEADNMDGYDTNTHESSGFPLTYQDQIAYNRFVAGEAHARGMAIALKNDIFQVMDLLSDFDMEVNEQCFQYSECNLVEPFVQAGKPVFECEYNLTADQFCPQAKPLNVSAIQKHVNLDAFRVGCP